MKIRAVKNIEILNSGFNSGVIYPAPINLTFSWNFGISAGVFLGIQIITGILLAMYYSPTEVLAFSSVRYILDNIDYGIALRDYHASGSSLFFLMVYLHIFRGLYYGSYLGTRIWLWKSGVIILLLMIVTAFIGYVLPWGQMSFWAATVITNLISVIPYFGNDILYWLWGGYSISDATLHRFFSLHYFLPFVILFLVILHVILLHEVGSNNPLGINFCSDSVNFYPYFIIKDLLSSIILLLFYNYYAYRHTPDILDYDNYLVSNPMVTPTHIVPEWYFKPFYAILRSVPDKTIGVLLLLASILVLLIFPYFEKPWILSSRFKPIKAFFFSLFVCDFVILGYIGGCSIEEPYYTIGQIATIYYFIFFLFILPFLAIIENYIFGRHEKFMSFKN